MARMADQKWTIEFNQKDRRLLRALVKNLERLADLKADAARESHATLEMDLAEFNEALKNVETKPFKEVPDVTGQTPYDAYEAHPNEVDAIMWKGVMYDRREGEV